MNPTQKTITSIFAIVAVAVTIIAVMYQPVFLRKANDKFSVDASSTADVKPETAKVAFSVVTNKAESAEAGSAANNQKMAAVIAALKKAGVDAKDIKTDQYIVAPNYVYDSEKGTNGTDGYNVTQQVTVTVRNVDAAGALITAATGAGADQVGSLQYDVKDATAAKDEARQKAIVKAKQKAAKIAKETGIRLGRLTNVEVSESDSGSVPVPMYARDMATSGSADKMEAAPIEVGTQEVVVSVRLTYDVR